VGPRSATVARALGFVLACAGVAACSAIGTRSAAPAQVDVATLPMTDVLARADGGDSLAQHRLCHAYSFGEGLQQDYARAFEWCTRASANDASGSSSTLLGDLYFHGRGVAQDADQARRWYEIAAARGHAHAQFMLGVIYQQGRGVAPNVDAARGWYESAAAAGSSLARDRLNTLPSK